MVFMIPLFQYVVTLLARRAHRLALAMAPTKGETLVERSSRLRVRSCELKGKACFNLVVAVLRAKPEICVD